MAIREMKTASPARTPGRGLRRNRRAHVSLDVRVRSADFRNGEFEEVRTTLNVSRQAIYFLTPLDRYFKGMRLRVSSPHGPIAGSGDWEDIGEVARVDHRADGRYGVAVLLSAPGHLMTPGGRARPSRKKSAEDRERRNALRYPFIAPAELVDVGNGTQISARTSDLSLQGCYVDTLNPFPLGTVLRVRILKADHIFETKARVSSRHPGSGMGLLFGELTPQQCALLVRWLAESDGAPEPAPMSPIRTEKTEQLAGVDELLSVSLIRALVRKGILSQAEAAALLGNTPL